MADSRTDRDFDGRSAHPYFPLMPGSVWSYATGQLHADRVLPGVRSTLRVVALRRAVGRPIAEIVDQVEAGQQSCHELVVTPDGLLPGVGTMRVGEIEVRPTDAVGLYLPFSVGLDLATTARQISAGSGAEGGGRHGKLL